MAVDKNKLEDLLRQLPEELQNQVLEFAESLVQNARSDLNNSGNGATSPVRAFFGIWDSGDQFSGDNDRIDADLAREYANSHPIKP